MKSKTTSSNNNKDYKTALRHIKKSNLPQLSNSITELRKNEQDFNNLISTLLIEASKYYDLQIFTYLESFIGSIEKNDNIHNVMGQCLDMSLTHSSDDISKHIIKHYHCIIEQLVDGKPLLQKIIDLDITEIFRVVIDSLDESRNEDSILHFFDTFSFTFPKFNFWKKLVENNKNEMFQISYDLLLSLYNYDNNNNNEDNNNNNIKNFYNKLISNKTDIIDICFENRNFEILYYILQKKSAPFYKTLLQQKYPNNNTILHRTASTFFHVPNAFDLVSSLLSDPSLQFPLSSLNDNGLTATEIYHSLLSESEALHKQTIARKEADIARIKEIKQQKLYRKSIECNVLVSVWLKENNLGHLKDKFGIAKVSSLDNLTKDRLLNFLNEEETLLVYNALEMKRRMEDIKKRENDNYLKRKKKVKKLLRMYQVDKEEDLPDGVVDQYLYRNRGNDVNRERAREVEEGDEYGESLLVEQLMDTNNTNNNSNEYNAVRNITRRIRNIRNNISEDGHTRMVTLVIMGYILFFVMLWFRRMFK